jgi:copper transport protein
MNKTRPSARPALGWLLSLTVIGLVGSLWAPTAHAETTLTSSTPEEGSTVATSPTEITLTFSAPIGPTNQVTMTCGDAGTVVGLAPPQRLADGVSLSVPLVAVAPAGKCTVGWSITSADGQPAGSNNLTFTIAGNTAATVPGSVITVAGGTVPPTTAAPKPAATGDTATGQPSSGPLALFRLFSNLGVAVLFGSLVVIAIAWPEGIEYIITVRFLRSLWIFTAASTYLFAGALAANVSGEGIGAALVPTSWGSLFDSTPGKAAFLRMVFVIVASFAVSRPERVIDPGAQFPALVPPGIAVATAAFSRETFGMFDYAVGIVHVLAMAVWFGGLVLLTRVVLAGPGEEDLVHAVRGFGRISTPAMWATVATGAVQLFRLDRGSLLSTSHGLTVILKTLTVSVMVFVAVAARQFINGRLTRVEVMTAPLALRLRRALGIEALLGVVVLGLTGVLLTMSPPGLDAAPLPDLDLGIVHVFKNEQLGVEASVAFSEKVGLNDVRIELIAVPPAGISGLAVDFIPPAGTAVNGMTINVPLTGPGAAVLRKSSNFRLDTAGVWTVRVRVGTDIVQSSDIQVNEASTINTIVATNPTGATTPVTGTTPAAAVSTTG